jgi:RHS repeat-associated protein
MAVGNTIGKLNAEPKMRADTPSGSANPPEKKSWWSRWGDVVHTGLDILGAVPVIGIVADGANAAIYAAEGDYVNAAISGASAAANLIPGGGAAMKAGKAAVAVGKQVTKTVAKEGAEAALKAGAKKAGKEVAEEGAEQAGKKLAKEAGSTKGGAGKGSAKKPKSCKLGLCKGNPVNPVLGIKFLTGGEDLDFDLPAPLRLPWQRSYFSDQSGNGWLGEGWSTPLSMRMVRHGEGLVLIDDQGREIALPELEEGDSDFNRYESIQITRGSNGRYRVSAVDGNVHYEFAPLDIDAQDVSGARSVLLPLVAMEDRNGNLVRIVYDAAGLPQWVIDSAQRTLQLQFGLSGEVSARPQPRLLQVVLIGAGSGDGTAGNELLVRYEYSAAGDLVRVYGGHGELRREFAYDNHILVQHSQPGGRMARYEYDQYTRSGRVLRHTLSTGQWWQFDYAAEETWVLDNLGRKEGYRFNADQELVARIDAAGAVTRFEQNAWGKLTAVIDPAGRARRFHYDAEGNRTAIVEPDGSRVEVQYHERWRLPTAITDAGGATVIYDYDAAGNLIRETDALGNVTSYNHDARGLVIRITDPQGGRRKLDYDACGQLVAHTDCIGNVTRFRWDARGRQLAHDHADGTSTAYRYDGRGRLVKVEYPDGSSESYGYDDMDRVVRFTDTGGQSTGWEFAADGLPVQRTDAKGQQLRYQYDGARRLVVLTNENGSFYRLAYDAKDNIVGEQGFDGRVTLYSYDACDQLFERRELGTQPGPGVELVEDNVPEMLRTTYSRDIAGRVVAKVTGRAKDKRVLRSQYTYDTAGRLQSAASDGGRVELAYDLLGRVVQESVQSGSDAHAVGYTYDALGNRTQTLLPDGRKVCSHFHGPGFLHRIDLDGTEVAAFERDAMQRETARSQGALTSYFDYDVTGRLVGQRAKASELGAQDKIARQYVYERSGNLRAANDLRFGQTIYEHDPLGRLVRAGNERFAFDPAHNLVQSDGEVLKANRVVHYGDKQFSYDTHGNLVEKRVGNHTLLQLRYDPEHRLESVQTTRNGVVQKTSYGYDAFGRRTFKRDAFGTTAFVWDGNRLLQEQRGEHCHVYIYEPEGFVPVAQWDSGSARTDGSVAAAGKVRYFHTDQIGAPRELTDTDGSVSWRASYRAWGATLVVEYPEVPREAEAAAAPVHQPLRFQGQYFDAETGLHYNRFRYYDPDIGRYVSQDPIRLAGGLNFYQYAPDPLQWIDPLGLAKRKRDLSGTDASGRPLSSPFYSSWVRTKIPCDLFQGTRAQHFKDANEQLYNMIKQDPSLGTALGPKVVSHVQPGKRGGFSDKSPPGLTWHHNAQDPTFMDLVPRAQHKAPGPVQDSMHPAQQGGFKKLKDC